MAPPSTAAQKAVHDCWQALQKVIQSIKTKVVGLRRENPGQASYAAEVLKTVAGVEVHELAQTWSMMMEPDGLSDKEVQDKLKAITTKFAKLIDTEREIQALLKASSSSTPPAAA